MQEGTREKDDVVAQQMCLTCDKVHYRVMVHVTVISINCAEHISHTVTHCNVYCHRSSTFACSPQGGIIQCILKPYLLLYKQNYTRWNK